jgi:hypothetical protein
MILKERKRHLARLDLLISREYSSQVSHDLGIKPGNISAEHALSHGGHFLRGDGEVSIQPLNTLVKLFKDGISHGPGEIFTDSDTHQLDVLSAFGHGVGGNHPPAREKKIRKVRLTE